MTLTSWVNVFRFESSFSCLLWMLYIYMVTPWPFYLDPNHCLKTSLLTLKICLEILFLHSHLQFILIMNLSLLFELSWYPFSSVMLLLVNYQLEIRSIIYTIINAVISNSKNIFDEEEIGLQLLVNLFIVPKSRYINQDVYICFQANMFFNDFQEMREYFGTCLHIFPTRCDSLELLRSLFVLWPQLLKSYFFYLTFIAFKYWGRREEEILR